MGFWRDADFAKKIIFSDEAHFDLEKPTHPKRVTVWCGFRSIGIIGPFFFENEQGVAVTVNCDRYRTIHPKRVTVWCEFWSRGIIGPFFFENEQGVPSGQWRSLSDHVEPSCFCSQKLKIGFSRTALRATQPKLHSIFWALFLKIALSATELMSFGHLGAAI